MARVTVEDCIDKVPNRFELVLLSSHRARQISAGSQIAVDRDNDKNPVVALREIAEQTLSPGDLKEDLIHSLQKHVEVDEPEEHPNMTDDALIESDLPEFTNANQSAPFNTLSEEELLAGLQNLRPPERSDDF